MDNDTMKAQTLRCEFPVHRLDDATPEGARANLERFGWEFNADGCATLTRYSQVGDYAQRVTITLSREELHELAVILRTET